MNNEGYEKFHLETPLIFISFLMFFICMGISFLVYTSTHIIVTVIKVLNSILPIELQSIKSTIFLYVLLIIIPALIWYIAVSIFVEPLYIGYRIKDFGISKKLIFSRVQNGIVLSEKVAISLIGAYFFYKYFLKEVLIFNYPKIILVMLSIILSSTIVFSIKRITNFIKGLI